MTRIVTLLLGIVVAFGAAAATPRPVAAADDVANQIPGVPFLEAGVTGSVGGDAYDLVWRYVVPTGTTRIVLFRLDGEEGAELGLYLFRGSATSIYTNTAFERSAFPGGDQQILVSLGAGTYYLDVNGRNTGRAYGFSLTASLLGDATPPTIYVQPSVRLTSTATISLSIVASDTLSGVTGVRLSADGLAWGEWIPCPVFDCVLQIPYTLSDGDGTKRIYAQAMNGSGVMSAPVNVTVRLDTTAPTVAGISPASGGSTGAARPGIAIRFNEAIDAGVLASFGITVLNSEGRAISGISTYNATAFRVTFTPDLPLTLYATYTVILPPQSDPAGNRSAGITTWNFRRLQQPTITVTAPYAASKGAKVRLTVRTTGIPAGALLTLYRSIDGGKTYTEVKTLQGAGGYPVTTTVTQVAGVVRYKVRFSGDAKRAVASVVRLVR